MIAQIESYATSTNPNIKTDDSNDSSILTL